MNNVQSSQDRDNRQSWGLGITLTNNNSRTNNDRVDQAILAGELESGGLDQQFSLTNTADVAQINPSSIYGNRRDSAISNGGGVSLFFKKLGSGLTSLVTSLTSQEDADEMYLGSLGSKSHIEDMLESFYLSHGRSVPNWVHDPPNDPPMDIEQRPSGIVVGSGNTPAILSNSGSDSGGNEDTSRSNSNIGNMFGRSFAKLNIGRFTRPTINLGLRSSASASGSAEEKSPRRNIGSAARDSNSFVYDSGFESPMVSHGGSLRHDNMLSIQVDEVKSGYEGADEFRMDSEQPSIASSGGSKKVPSLSGGRRVHTTGKHISGRPTRPSKPSTPSLFMERWLNREDSGRGKTKHETKPRRKSSVDLSLLLPGNNMDRMTAKSGSSGYQSDYSRTSSQLSWRAKNASQISTPSNVSPAKPSPLGNNSFTAQDAIWSRNSPSPLSRQSESLSLEFQRQNDNSDSRVQHRSGQGNSSGTAHGGDSGSRRKSRTGKVKRLFRRKSQGKN